MTVSFVGNSVTGSPPSSEGKQLGQASMDAQYCSRPVSFSTSLSSEDDPVSVAERVQQQAVVPMPQILKETVEVTEYVAPAQI